MKASHSEGRGENHRFVSRSVELQPRFFIADRLIDQKPPELFHRFGRNAERFAPSAGIEDHLFDALRQHRWNPARTLDRDYPVDDPEARRQQLRNVLIDGVNFFAQGAQFRMRHHLTTIARA